MTPEELIETPAYDFKGQPKSTTRRLFKKYKEVANWTDANLNADLELEDFTFITKTDALGRIKEQTAPDDSLITPTYNEASLLTNEHVKHADPDIKTTYIQDIDYNEKGQRRKIIYGNSVATIFHYDENTFRLIRLVSHRKNEVQNPLQNLHYSYDAVGNITHIEDKAIPISFFANSQIEPLSKYTYDATYRLITATGRENNTAINFGDCDNWNDKPFRQAMNRGDAMAVRDYTESYQYDAVGNIREMKHLATGGNWTRSYDYETTNNRLKSTHIGSNGNPANYTKYQHHDKHGFLEELPHLEKIGWNFKEEVVLTTRQHCTDDNIPETTYYQYDGTGQRIRKISERQTATGNMPIKKEERIYISGYEIYKKHSSANSGLERRTLSLMDDAHRFVMIETRNDGNFDTEKHLVRYQLHNHLGSASLELDGSPEAKVISYEEYHPYGTTAYQAKNEAIKSTAKRYCYTGMERDEESGLSYHSARYYLPWLGRWLSSDPIGIGDGSNLYQYVANNPIILIDPDGTQNRLSKLNLCTEDNPEGKSRFYIPEGARKPTQEEMESWERSKDTPTMRKDGSTITRRQYDNGHKRQRYGSWENLKTTVYVGAIIVAGPELLAVETGIYLAEGSTGVNLYNPSDLLPGNKNDNYFEDLSDTQRAEAGVKGLFGALLLKAGVAKITSESKVQNPGFKVENQQKLLPPGPPAMKALPPGPPAMKALPPGPPPAKRLTAGASSPKPKIKMTGKPQKTNRKGIPRDKDPHAVRSVEGATEAELATDVEGFYNKSWKVMTNGQVNSKLRPDVTIFSSSGSATAIEVVSPSDILADTIIKNLKVLLGMGKKSDGLFIIWPK